MERIDRRHAAAEEALGRLVPAAPRDVTEVIRDGAALLLRRGGVLVRVRPESDLSVAQREVRLAKTFESRAVPASRLIEPDEQPWRFDGHVVTGWAWTEHGDRVGPDDIGLLARTLRENTAVAAAVVPALDPLDAVVSAVGRLDADDPDVRFVIERAGQLAEPWAAAAAADPLGRAIVHGDLHAGNVIAGPGGPLLTDLELAGAGPSSYDAAPAVIAVSHYGAPARTVEQFMVGFGADPRRWSGFATFVEVYELWVTAWAVGVREVEPAWAEEATRRVATLRDGSDHRWHLS